MGHITGEASREINAAILRWMQQDPDTRDQGQHVAFSLGLSRAAFYKRGRRLRDGVKPPSHDITNHVRKILLNESLTIKELAARVGTHPEYARTIVKVLSELGDVFVIGKQSNAGRAAHIYRLMPHVKI